MEVRCTEPEVVPNFIGVPEPIIGPITGPIIGRIVEAVVGPGVGSIGQDTDTDQAFMDIALEEARLAEASDEVPIGAVIVVGGRVIARAHNRTRMCADPTAHAELLAVREACAELGAMRIPGAVVYTTVEPCFMCAGALSQARVERVVWAVRDPKFGGAVSLGHVLTDPRLNHRVSITEGVRADESRKLLQEFFRKKRGIEE